MFNKVFGYFLPKKSIYTLHRRYAQLYIRNLKYSDRTDSDCKFSCCTIIYFAYKTFTKDVSQVLNLFSITKIKSYDVLVHHTVDMPV